MARKKHAKAAPPLGKAKRADVSFVTGCVLVFLYGREEDQWAQWRADYSRAIDRLFFRQT